MGMSPSEFMAMKNGGAAPTARLSPSEFMARKYASRDTGTQQSVSDPGAEAVLGVGQGESLQDILNRPNEEPEGMEGSPLSNPIPTGANIEAGLFPLTGGMSTALPLAWGATKGVFESPKHMEPGSSLLDKAGVVAKSAVRGAVGESPMVNYAQEIASRKAMPRISEGQNVSDVNQMVTGSALPEWSKEVIDVGGATLGYTAPDVAMESVLPKGVGALPKRGDFTRQTPTSAGDELGVASREAMDAERARIESGPSVIYGGGNIPGGYRNDLPMEYVGDFGYGSTGRPNVNEIIPQTTPDVPIPRGGAVIRGAEEMPRGYIQAPIETLTEGGYAGGTGRLPANELIQHSTPDVAVPPGGAVVRGAEELPAGYYQSPLYVRGENAPVSAAEGIATEIPSVSAPEGGVVVRGGGRVPGGYKPVTPSVAVEGGPAEWTTQGKQSQLPFEKSGVPYETTGAETPLVVKPRPGEGRVARVPEVINREGAYATESPPTAPRPTPRPTETLPVTVAEGVDVPVEQPVPQRPTVALEGPRTQTIQRAERPTQSLSTESVTSGKLPVPNTEQGGASVPANLLERGWQGFKRFWNPLSTLPQNEKYQAIRNRTLGKIHQIEDFAGKVWDKTKNLSSDNKRDIFRYLDGQIEESALSPDVRPYAVRLRHINNSIGKLAVERGLMTEEQFLANKDAYVKHVYLRHVLGDKYESVVGSSGKLEGSSWKHRKDITIEQRRALGLIEDVSVAQPIGMTKSLNDIVKFDRMAAIAENPEWVWSPSVVEVKGANGKTTKMGMGKLVEEVQNQRRVYEQAPNVPEVKARLDELEAALKGATENAKNVPQDFVQLPVNKNYGNLSGAFVRTEIARDIIPVIQEVSDPAAASKLLNVLRSGYRASVRGFKVGKTALNLPTVARNTISNPIQLNMSGIPWYDMPGLMKDAAVSISKRDSLYRAAKNNGLFKTNFSQTEIAEILDAVRTMQGGTMSSVLGGVKKITNAYGKIDDFFKLVKFSEQMKKGVTVQKAAIEAQKWGMDYSNAHPVIKWMRNDITPFVSYPYKITPLIAESIAKRPWVIAKYAAIPYAMHELAKKSLNLTEKDFDELKKQLPLFIHENQAMTILPWKSPEGHVQWVNLEYFFPWQQMMAAYRDVKKGKWGEMASDMGLGNPFYDAYTVAKTMKGDSAPKDPRTGAEIYNKLDSPTDKAVKTAEWMYGRIAPPMLTRQGALGSSVKAAEGAKDRYGRTVTPGVAAAKWVGINAVAPTPMQAALERKQKIRELQMSLGAIMKDPTVPAEKKKAAMMRFTEQSKQLFGAE